MMDGATIVLTAVVIVAILQIVTIALIVDTRKKTKTTPAQDQPPRFEPQDGKKPREADNRFNRRPQQEQRNKPAPAQPQNVEQVERSLRDINLRLKNAERDQEKERKRIKDSIGPQGQRKFDHQKPRDRDEGFRRNDRQRNDYHQNRSSDSQRGHRDDRQPSRPTFEVKEPVQAPVQPIQPVQQVQQPRVETPVAVNPPALQPVTPPIAEPVFETAQPADQKENLQHGRKVMVKRRVLNVEEENAANGVENQTAESAPEPVKGAQETAQGEGSDRGNSNDQQPSDGTAISFGR